MWLPKSVESMVFDPTLWESLTDPYSVPVSDLAIGVDAPPSRDAATVCVAGRRADGRLHVEWYSPSRVSWLPEWVASHMGRGVRAVVVDERGALAELDWAGAKVRPTFVGTRDVADAPVFFGTRSPTACWCTAASWSCRGRCCRRSSARCWAVQRSGGTGRRRVRRCWWRCRWRCGVWGVCGRRGRGVVRGRGGRSSSDRSVAGLLARPDVAVVAM